MQATDIAEISAIVAIKVKQFLANGDRWVTTKNDNRIIIGSDGKVKGGDAGAVASAKGTKTPSGKNPNESSKSGAKPPPPIPGVNAPPNAVLPNPPSKSIKPPPPPKKSSDISNRLRGSEEKNSIPKDEWSKEVERDSDIRKAFNDFTGDDYKKMNNPPPEERARKMITALEKQKSIDSNIPLYRGMNFRSRKEADNFVKSIDKGFVQDKVFSSFSEDAKVADRFAKSGGRGSITIKVNSHKSAKSISGISQVREEKEALFAIGTRFKVSKITGSSGNYQIEVDES